MPLDCPPGDLADVDFFEVHADIGAAAESGILRSAAEEGNDR